MNCEFIIEVAKEAGAYALEHFGLVRDSGKNMSGGDDEYQAEKTAFSFVDASCQKIILQRIGEKYPKRFGVIAEESTDEIRQLTEKYFTSQNKVSGETIVIDPIDGTKNYVPQHDMKAGYWGVSITVLNNNSPEMAVVFYPKLDILLHAERGKGTFVNNQKILLTTREYHDAHQIRISGAHENAKELRTLFPKSESTSSFVVTLLALLEQKNLPEYKAYIGKNAQLVDLAPALLAYVEAGGVIVGEKGNHINPLNSLYTKDNILRVQETFILAPSQSYAQEILKKIS